MMLPYSKDSSSSTSPERAYFSTRAILGLNCLIGVSMSGFTARVPDPEKGGDGFKRV